MVEKKISLADDALRAKGGFAAFFNDGMTFPDAFSGNISKRTLVVEDDSLLRERIRERFSRCALTTFCAQDYSATLRLIHPRFANVKRFSYAILDDQFPERRGEKATFLAEKVVDALLQEHPGVRIFGYVEDDHALDLCRYVAILRKDQVSLDELYRLVITDAETVR